MNDLDPAVAARVTGGARLTNHGLPIAVVAALAGGGLAALAGGQAWLHGPAAAQAPGGRVSGTLAVPLALAAGLVGLAAAGGLLGTAGRARRFLGGLCGLLGAAGAVATVLALVRPAATYRAAVQQVGTPETAVRVTATAWPVIALLGLLAVVFAGALTVARGAAWPALGRRYERRPGGSPAAASRPAAGPAADWDALDAGVDPTVTQRPAVTRRPAVMARPAGPSATAGAERDSVSSPDPSHEPAPSPDRTEPR